MNKRLAIGLLVFWSLLGCGVASYGATLRVRATSPASDNVGTCEAPILRGASPSDSLWLFFEIPQVGIRDSIRTGRGTLVVKSYLVPAPGSYIVRSYACVMANGRIIAGCDTTASLLTAQPWKPVLGQ